MPEQKPVLHCKAEDVKTAHGQTDGMTRQSALVSVAPNICGTLMRAAPHSSSAVHHHGEENTIVYAVSGHGSVIYANGEKKVDLKPGDWALIPAYAEHQEANQGDEEVVWVIVRSGEAPIVENLKAWGESLK